MDLQSSIISSSVTGEEPTVEPTPADTPLQVPEVSLSNQRADKVSWTHEVWLEERVVQAGYNYRVTVENDRFENSSYESGSASDDMNWEDIEVAINSEEEYERFDGDFVDIPPGDYDLAPLPQPEAPPPQVYPEWVISSEDEEEEIVPQHHLFTSSDEED